ncbi:hypothetical protein JL193_15235 [Polaribacter batillariae]|uniref:Invasion gene expression up-regulator, SirB n=1 Tax=Polaribacter batillariae TaxID=2808900 RepID=A0ABX7SVT8_9FLAO|nr:hypothetical protein [Polaribacter batillariae]QTD37425.1 hypothetical protein JL193_15235 [Polaribacter batillariae]
MVLQLKIIGILLSILAFIHVGFSKYFKWKIELKSLSLINRQIMAVHTFFIALVVLLIGLLCLTSSNELIYTKLGKRISLGLGVFWSIRLLFQLFVYSPKLWRRKKFETAMHIIFTIFWMYLTVIFLCIYSRY